MKTAYHRANVIRRGLFAGVVGGAAEVVWISAVAIMTTISALDVARGVSESFGIGGLSSAQAVAAGIAIHMALAIGLGVAVALACHLFASEAIGGGRMYLIIPAALIGVWAINFMILLPLINPDFVNLVPYPVSFVSKLLFGLGAAEVLRRNRGGVCRRN